MNDAICALATAPGGALGIIRISGPKVLEILSRVFTKDLTAALPNTIHYGHIVESDAVSQHKNIIDEVLVSIFRAPHSYTGEDSAEISCHGSRYIINKVLELLIQQGCRMAEPGEYTQRAYLNGKMDLSQAEAVADLIASTNKATHQIAMSQLRGHFSTEELELDFSDHEDLEFADRTELLDLTKKIDSHITRLAESFETGQTIKQGIPVAIVGKTNVGKSTLLNRLLKEDRAIVSDVHGTTRDTIEDTIDIQGITFRFIDTAGIRHTDDTIERIGIEPGVPYPDITVRDDQTVIRIENKTETFQAKYGVGLDALRQRLVDAAPKTNANDVIVTNARHYDALLRAHDSIQRVIDGLQQQLSGDLLSEDLRQALDTLAEITGGQITPQETLNNIFQHFCVGK